MFLGTHAPKLDDKGRVILPAKFREELSSGLVVARGIDRCVFVYSQRGFEEVVAKLKQSSVTSKQQRDFLRAFLSSASQEMPDSQNRITIPPYLREFASLERDLTVIGVGERAEIWNSESWNTYYESVESDFINTTEEVIPGLF